MTEKTESREQLKEMRLGSGEAVIDRPDSHLHEGLGDLLDQALTKVNSEGRDFIKTEVDFGYEVGNSSLVETTEGDVIIYAQRPRRIGLTRFVKNREPESCSRLTVILKKGTQGQLPGDYYVLLTAYIGYLTPAEPWAEKEFKSHPDPEAEQKKSQEFWNNHALIYGEEPIIPGTETDTCPW